MHEWDTVVSALISGNFRFMLVLVSAQTTIQLFPETQQCCQSCKRGQSQIWGVRKWAASDGQLCLALFHSLITLDGARFCCNIYGERGKKRKSTLDQMSFKLQKSGRQNKKHKSQMSCMISLRQITPSASLLSKSVFSPSVSQHTKEDDWQRRPAEPQKSIYGFQSPVAGPPPLSPLPLSSPAKSIPCRDFIDSGKGAVI